MKYYLDTEFHEYKKHGVDTIDLISIGIVREDGETFYHISSEFFVNAAWQNDWLKQNVLKPIFFEALVRTEEFSFTNFKHYIKTYGASRDKIRQDILDWIGDDKPEFYGYYADYDWVVFCWLFGRMIDLPKNFPMYCRDLKQSLDEAVKNMIYSDGERVYMSDSIKEHPDYPQQENEHNALDDARWNLKLHRFIKIISGEDEKYARS